MKPRKRTSLVQTLGLNKGRPLSGAELTTASPGHPTQPSPAARSSSGRWFRSPQPAEATRSGHFSFQSGPGGSLNLDLFVILRRSQVEVEQPLPGQFEGICRCTRGHKMALESGVSERSRKGPGRAPKRPRNVTGRPLPVAPWSPFGPSQRSTPPTRNAGLCDAKHCGTSSSGIDRDISLSEKVSPCWFQL
jgi:hypothetical protein